MASASSPPPSSSSTAPSPASSPTSLAADLRQRLYAGPRGGGGEEESKMQQLQMVRPLPLPSTRAPPSAASSALSGVVHRPPLSSSKPHAGQPPRRAAVARTAAVGGKREGEEKEGESLASAGRASHHHLAAAARPPPSSLYPSESSVEYLSSPFAFIDAALSSGYSDDFVYLHPISPYELRVVGHEEVNPLHYLTMSRSGVTHFHHSESSFTSLSQWEREYFTFQRIRRLRFFQQYPQWKALRVWRRSIRQAKMRRSSRILQHSLDTLNPHLRPALLQVKAMLHRASSWPLFVLGDRRQPTAVDAHAALQPAAPSTSSRLSIAVAPPSSSSSASPLSFPLSLPSLISAQRSQQAWLRCQLSSLSDECRSIVLAACSSDLQHFLQLNGFSSNDDAARRVSHAEKAAHRTKCRKLSHFIRLVDFLCIDHLLSLTQERSVDVLHHLQHASSRALSSSNSSAGSSASLSASSTSSSSSSVSLLTVELELSDASSGHCLLFHPSPSEWEAEVVRMVEEGVASAIEQYQQLLYSPTFHAFTKTAIDDSHRQQPQQPHDGRDAHDSEHAAAAAAAGSPSQSMLSVSVLSSASFRHTLDGIRRSLSSAFASASAFTASIHVYRDMFVRHEQTDVVAAYSTASIPVYSALILQFQQEIAQLQSMPTQSSVGLLCVDSTRLKALFTPSPKARLSELERLLPAVAREKVKAQLAQLKEAISHLSSIPSSVAEFVALQAFLQRLQATAEDEQAGFTFLTELYALMATAQLRVQESEKVAFDKLHTTRQQYKTQLLLAEGALNANTERFARELEQQQPQLQQATKRAKDTLKDPRLSDVAELAHLPAVLSLLREQAAEVDSLEQRVSVYLQQQAVLQLEASTALSEELRLVKADCEVKLSLWSALHGWADVTDRWIHTPFTDIDVDDIAAQVHAYQAVHSKAKRRLPDNPVVQRLQENIDEFADTLPVVSDLRSRHLQPHHWTQIEALLGYNIHARPPAAAAGAAAAASSSASVTNHTPSHARGVEEPPLVAGASPTSTTAIVANLAAATAESPTSASSSSSSSSSSSFTLGTLIELNAMQYREEIGVIANSAAQEAALQASLDGIVQTWAALQLTVSPYKEQKDVFILVSCDEVVQALDDSLVSINALLSSRYVEPMREAVLDWHRRLTAVSDCIDEWLAVQRQWLYLEVIFASGDIVRQLPEESSAFGKVDRAWKELMRRTNDSPNALAQTTAAGLRDALHTHNSTLERVQKQLESYLETRRHAFPRFYFLSNDELLLILAQAKSPEAVQPHLAKCFDAIHRLELTDSRDIRAMISPEGERVALSPNLKARGPAEAWLPALEADMLKSLKRLIRRGVQDYANTESRREWILAHHAQVVAVGSLIAWARQAEQCINGDSGTELQLSEEGPHDGASGVGGDGDSVRLLSAFLQLQLGQLGELTELVRGPLSSLERRKVISLITTDVHSRDITAQLLQLRVSSTASFVWQQQLRFTWDAISDDCVAQQANASFTYGYEFMGAASRLVITPLTDRCWMTITGALQLRFGAAPQGPAGTGKTESTKDLAKALGQFCVVVNCSEGMNFHTLGKLFAGLCQTGAWACLDEFNRIDIEVLSVVAQQLLQVRQALLMQQQQLTLEAQLISLRPTFGCMITMNPGYAGRTELPENLKVLFRPVSMMIPDYALIAELMLFAEGFTQASALALKMVRLYKLCSEQLSQQQHYDFGMRAVKSVLNMAGQLRRAQPHDSETTTLIKAIRNANEAKFLSDDLPLFAALIEDLFPRVVVSGSVDASLESAILSAVSSAGLQAHPGFLLKVRQLFDTLGVRFGVMLVGDTGAGKSACHRVLAAALNLLHHAQPGPAQPLIVTTSLNPKAISMDELYGSVSPLTQEWSDGLASSIMRTAMDDRDPLHHHWIHFDGPVDALWIESMNTVLDDNATLCLVNGERMKLKQEMRMLFEVQDLAVASPATVSRCGMVYMTAHDLTVLPLITSWLSRVYAHLLPSAVFAHLHAAFTRSLPLAVSFLRSKCSESVGSSDCQLVWSVSRLFQATLQPALDQLHHTTQQQRSGNAEHAAPAPHAADTNEELAVIGALLPPSSASSSSTSPSLSSADEGGLQALLDLLLCFSICWGVGGGLEGADADAFQAWLTTHFAAVAPTSAPVSSHYVDVVARQWRLWDELVPAFSYSASTPYYELLVPTVNTVRYQALLSHCLSVSAPVYLTGGSGVGKSALISDFFSPAARQRFSVISLTFSVQSSSRQTQEAVEAKLVKYRKNLLGPAQSLQAVLVVDDVNLCGVEAFGAQPPVELLRQLLEYGGWYDRDKLFFKQLTRITPLCAAAPARGGGRHELSRRFLKHFSLLTLPQPSQAVLCHIFNSTLQGVLSTFAPSVQQLREDVVLATVQLYSQLSTHLLPSPSKAHYTFNLRDVSKVIGGLAMVRPHHCPSPFHLVRLWAHECMRQFSDRLVDADDVAWFHAQLAQLAAQRFHQHQVQLELTELSSRQQPLLFHDWMPTSDEREYALHSYDDAQQQAEGKRQKQKEQQQRGEGTEEESDERAAGPIDGDSSSSSASPSPAAPTSALSLLLDDALVEYNAAHSSAVELVFFPSAVAHVARLSRILRQARGHALLVGVGGSGKQSYTRLAAHMAGMACMTCGGGVGYGYAEFQADLRRVLLLAGLEGRDVVLLLNESSLGEDACFEDVNALLNSGDVANLFTGDELTALLDALLPVVRDASASTSRDSLYSAFVSRVQLHLHVVLCMSPVGSSFRMRCRQFPALINCTTVDWYDKWPTSALQQVATHTLSSLQLSDEHTRAALVRCCVAIHCSVESACTSFSSATRRAVYTTPKSYLDWLQLFLSMLDERRSSLAAARAHFVSGLTKFRETQLVVAELQEELTQLQPVLASKAEESTRLLERIEVDAAKAAGVRVQVESEESVVNAAAVEVRELTAEAQADLDAALPALKSALRSLEKLKKAEISEVKSMASPPSGVVKVMEMVCLLLQATPDWDSAKRVLANVNFLKDLQSFDRDNIDPKSIRKLQKYTLDPELTEERMLQVSKAGAALLGWVLAMVDYSRVSKVVGPKKEKLAELAAALQDKEAQLSDKRAQLTDVQAALDALQAQLERAQGEKAELDERSQLTAARLERAEKLLGGLGGEEVRWKEEAEKLTTSMRFVVADAFLAAAAVAYYGPFNQPFRQQLVDTWKAIVQREAERMGGAASEGELRLSADWSLQSTLGVAHEIRSWLSNGLPTDACSVDSALLMRRAVRWPLCIDPQEQAKRWVKAEWRTRLLVTRMQSKDCMRLLELAIRTGCPLLIEDVQETLDAQLTPVLSRAVYMRGSLRYIRLGDAEVEYSDKFRLMLTTKLPNPHYLPDVQMRVTLLNFTVTRVGLEEQLLGDVVKRERPDVEERTGKLVSMLAKDKRSLLEIEERILHLLASSSGNLLDNVPLIDTLEESRFTSHVIEDRVKDNLSTQRDMAAIREQYRSVAVRAALLFFLMQDLASVDAMYAFSLHSFTRLFHSALLSSPAADELSERLRLLQQQLTATLFTSTHCGLFERHKLAFAFGLAVAVEKEAGRVDDWQWRAFILDEDAFADATRGKDGVNPFAATPSAPAVLSDGAWRWLCGLQRVVAELSGVSDSFVSSNERWTEWRLWLQADDPTARALPGEWDGHCSPFNRLLLVRGLRPSQLRFACRAFVHAVLGADFASPPPPSLSDAVAAADGRTPILFILSQGADPTALLQRFARERKAALSMLSLGQGQGEVAAALLANAMAKGEWLLLCNLHLGKSWLPTLDELLDKLGDADDGTAGGGGGGGGGAAAGGAAGGGGVSGSSSAVSPPRVMLHPGFRLFLTSMPCAYFPTPLLQKAIKITNEPPAGVKHNLSRSYTTIVQLHDLDQQEQADEQPDHADQEPAQHAAALSLDSASVAPSNPSASSPSGSASLLAGSASGFAFRKLLFSLCLFHAVVQERRAFGPLGFVNHRGLEWNDSDLETSIATLRLLLQQASEAQQPLPWDALRYVVGDIHYGGRVTDEGDRRVLSAMLQRFFTPEILSDAHAFTPSGLYRVPPDGSHASYLRYIEQLPDSAAPEVFAMHSNATLTLHRQESAQLLDTLRLMQPRGAQAHDTHGQAKGGAGAQSAGTPSTDESGEDASSSGGDEAAVVVSADDVLVAKAQQLLAQLPPPLSREGAVDGLFAVSASGVLPSLSVVLAQEMERFNRLLSVMRSSLLDLQRAVRGELLMSAQLDDVAVGMASNAVPRLWSALAYPSLASLQRWLADLLQRVAFFRQWLQQGPPRDYWLSAFFFPQGFLTAVLQQHARSTGQPIDGLQWAFTVIDPSQQSASGVEELGGVVVRGLFCEGGRWSVERSLLEDAKDGELLSELPPIRFQPVPAAPDAAASSPSSLSYACPVYKTSLRAGQLSTTGQSTNFVLSIDLPAAQPASYWTLRGTAALCQPD